MWGTLRSREWEECGPILQRQRRGHGDLRKQTEETEKRSNHNTHTIPKDMGGVVNKNNYESKSITILNAANLCGMQ